MTLPTKPLGRVTLIDSLVAQLEDLILSGELVPGARLPSEDQVAGQFGVSRPVVREAFGRLRERGLLETLNGSGTFVRHPQPDRLADALLRQLQLQSASGAGSLANLYEVRIAIESTSARLAAQRASAAEKAQIRTRYDEMKAAKGDREQWAGTDLAFHLAVADASHNPFVATLLSPLVEVIRLGNVQAHESPEAVAHGLRLHLRVTEAIEAGDAEAAAKAMTDHLRHSERYLAQTVGKDAKKKGSR